MVKEIMSQSIPGEKTKLAKLRGLRENVVFMKHQSKKWRGGENTKAIKCT
jgi:hypothetical protein